jgi:hypothetical protein
MGRHLTSFWNPTNHTLVGFVLDQPEHRDEEPFHLFVLVALTPALA